MLLDASNVYSVGLWCIRICDQQEMALQPVFVLLRVKLPCKFSFFLSLITSPYSTGMPNTIAYKNDLSYLSSWTQSNAFLCLYLALKAAAFRKQKLYTFSSHMGCSVSYYFKLQILCCLWFWPNLFLKLSHFPWIAQVTIPLVFQLPF